MRCRPCASPTLELMKAETPDGRCVFCPAPASRGVTCGSDACLRGWAEVYWGDVLDARKVLRTARGGLTSLSHQWLRRRARRAA